MTFEAPLWLWLALSGIPAGAMALRLLGGMTPVRRWSVALARACLIALLAMTLAGASSVRRTNRLAVVAVVDASGSVLRFAPATLDDRGRPRSAIDRVRDWLAWSARSRGPDDLLGIVLFDGESLAIAAPTAGDPLARPLEPAGAEGTDIASALRLARALIPADAAGRLVLFSDGNQTTGDALGAAREVSSPLGRRGPTPIDAVPIEYQLTREVFIESIDAPPTATAEATITLRIVMVATTASRGLLRVLDGQTPIDASPGREGDGLAIALEAGRSVIAVPVALSASRTHRFVAIYEPEVLDPGATDPVLSGDTDIANNRAEAFTVTPGRGSILVLDGEGHGSSSGPGAALADVWREAGLDVTIVSPEAMPTDLLTLQSQDLVVLLNTPADALGPEGQALLDAYVRELGGGLLTLGGREAYGAGGWKGSALEELIPVSLDLPERLMAPEIAVVFVLDRSGSMAWSVRGTSRSQMDIATEAAAAAVRSLQPSDLVGVITFNLDHDVVVPLAPNSDANATAARILEISPDGGTATGAALREAQRQLASSDAKSKHIIILSDGQAMDADTLPEIAQSLRAQGVTISTIVIGDGAHVESMRSVAYFGGGTFYEVVNPAILPRVFLKAVRILRTPMVREAAFQPAITGVGSPLTAGLPAPLPMLLGMNLTQPRSEPTAITSMVSPDGEPVLAHWQVELGQVVSFTSDAWRWGAPWLSWEGYRTLWTQVARLAARPPASRGMDLSASIAGERLEIRLLASDDHVRPLDLLTVDATVFAPDGTSRQTQLVQTGPGLYQADLGVDRSGSYVVVAKPRRGEQRLSPVVAGASVPDAREYRRLSSDRALMEQIAQSGAGRVLTLDTPSMLFDRAGMEPLRGVTPLWPVLVAWSLGVLLIDVGTRRIAWDRLTSRELRGRSVIESMADATRDRGRGAAATLGDLATRRARSSVPRGEPSAALSDLDAFDTSRRVQEAQRAQRIEAARAAMRAGSEGRGSSSAPPAHLPPVTDGLSAAPPLAAPSDVESSEAETPLLRAKRRARERLSGDHAP